MQLIRVIFHFLDQRISAFSALNWTSSKTFLQFQLQTITFRSVSPALCLVLWVQFFWLNKRIPYCSWSIVFCWSVINFCQWYYPRLGSIQFSSPQSVHLPVIPSNAVLIPTSAPPNTRCCGREPVGKLFSFPALISLTFSLLLLSVCLHLISTFAVSCLSVAFSVLLSHYLSFTLLYATSHLPLLFLIAPLLSAPTNPPGNFSLCLFSVCEEVLDKARVDILGIYGQLECSLIFHNELQPHPHLHHL